MRAWGHSLVHCGFAILVIKTFYLLINLPLFQQQDGMPIIALDAINN